MNTTAAVPEITWLHGEHLGYTYGVTTTGYEIFNAGGDLVKVVKTQQTQRTQLLQGALTWIMLDAERTRLRASAAAFWD